MLNNHLVKFLKDQSKLYKRLILICTDIFLSFIAIILCSILFGISYFPIYLALIIVSLTGIIFFYRGLHDNVIGNIGLKFISNSMILIISTYSIYSIIVYFILNVTLSKIIFTSGFLVFFLILLSRVIANFLLYQNKNPKEKIILYTDYKNISEAISLASSSKNFDLVGIINLQKKNKGRYIDNIKIYGVEDFSTLVEKFNIRKLFIISNNNIKNLDENLFNQIISFPIKVFKIPDMNDIITKKDNFSDLKHLSLEDFIAREVNEKVDDSENFETIITDKVVMVTGAGGSIGSILSKQVVKEKPSKLILIDNSEIALFKIISRLKKINSNIEIIPRLINISDYNAIKSITREYKINTVYHAAAYKHVNILESEIKSAIVNNIIGTYNLLSACDNNGIDKFVMISTDKAATPTTVMGKTKKFCELIVEYFNKKNKNSAFLSVRFGNVFNSSGSVIQIFKEQIENGEDLTLTDPNVDRFFMSIDEAVKLVIKASQMGRGGEVFVLDMGTPIKIIDIAKRMIHLSGNTIKNELNPNGDIGIKITGLQKGEKMHEILSESPIDKTDNPQIMLATESRKIDKLEEKINQIKTHIQNDNLVELNKILSSINT
tara:strand:+ start:32192 stop:34009 length:1818 start_codon:yes stop_codon:yes gene_type:complete